jgi:hypothetical protein
LIAVGKKKKKAKGEEDKPVASGGPMKIILAEHSATGLVQVNLPNERLIVIAEYAV